MNILGACFVGWPGMEFARSSFWITWYSEPVVNRACAVTPATSSMNTSALWAPFKAPRVHGSDWRACKYPRVVLELCWVPLCDTASQSRKRFTAPTRDLSVAALRPAPRRLLGCAASKAPIGVGVFDSIAPNFVLSDSSASFLAFGPWYRPCWNLARTRRGALSAASKNLSEAVFSSFVSCAACLLRAWIQPEDCKLETREAVMSCRSAARFAACCNPLKASPKPCGKPPSRTSEW